MIQPSPPPARSLRYDRRKGPPGPARPDATTAIASVATVLLWGSSFPGFRAALESYTPGPLLLLRFAIASAALAALALATRMPMPAWRDVPHLAGLGVIGVTVCQLSLVYGEQTVSAGTASFLMALVPVFTALLAALVLGERLTVFGWSGIALALVGTLILVAGQEETIDITLGAALVVLAALSEAVYFVLQKPFLRRFSGLQLATYTLWAATVPLVAFTPGLLAELPRASQEATLAVLYLAVGAGALGYISWSIANSRLPASVASTLLAVTPVTAVLIAWPWLGEIPTLLSLAGGAVTVAGVLVVTRFGTGRTGAAARWDICRPGWGENSSNAPHEREGDGHAEGISRRDDGRQRGGRAGARYCRSAGALPGAVPSPAGAHLPRR